MRYLLIIPIITILLIPTQEADAARFDIYLGKPAVTDDGDNTIHGTRYGIYLGKAAIVREAPAVEPPEATGGIPSWFNKGNSFIKGDAFKK